MKTGLTMKTGYLLLDKGTGKYVTSDWRSPWSRDFAEAKVFDSIKEIKDYIEDKEEEDEYYFDGVEMLEVVTVFVGE